MEQEIKQRDAEAEPTWPAPVPRGQGGERAGYQAAVHLGPGGPCLPARPVRFLLRQTALFSWQAEGTEPSTPGPPHRVPEGDALWAAAKHCHPPSQAASAWRGVQEAPHIFCKTPPCTGSALGTEGTRAEGPASLPAAPGPLTSGGECTGRTRSGGPPHRAPPGPSWTSWPSS